MLELGLIQEEGDSLPEMRLMECILSCFAWLLLGDGNTERMDTRGRCGAHQCGYADLYGCFTKMSLRCVWFWTSVLLEMDLVLMSVQVKCWVFLDMPMYQSVFLWLVSCMGLTGELR